ncbi:hypothetical protein ACVWZA_000986 [Sphingomonas sp. UYAg733]
MIEGWALASYDIAPWGATGNVRSIGFGAETILATRHPDHSKLAPSPEANPLIASRCPDSRNDSHNTAP